MKKTAKPQFSALVQNLKMRRAALGMSQDELADRSGVSLRTISDIERGESDPRFNTLESLAEALLCTVEHLIQPIGALGTKTMVHTRPAVKGFLIQSHLQDAADLLSTIAGLSKERFAVVMAVALADPGRVSEIDADVAQAVRALLKAL